MRISISARLASFRPAFSGLRWLVINERNARIHLAATAVVVVLGVVILGPPLWAALR